MNHPYLYPDEAPWTDDYWELRAIRNTNRLTNDDSDELETHADCLCSSAAATQR
jgi:hypothetical protein